MAGKLFQTVSLPQIDSPGRTAKDERFLRGVLSLRQRRTLAQGHRLRPMRGLRCVRDAEDERTRKSLRLPADADWDEAILSYVDAIANFTEAIRLNQRATSS